MNVEIIYMFRTVNTCCHCRLW